jgi:hypothetical protein
VNVILLAGKSAQDMSISQIPATDKATPKATKASKLIDSEQAVNHPGGGSIYIWTLS